IREALVMSLETFIGPKPNLLDLEETTPPPRLEASQPVLLPDELELLKTIAALTQDRYRALTLDTTYDAVQGEAVMAAAIEALCQTAEHAVRDGYNLLFLSDRAVSAQRVAIPAQLGRSATHQHL